ncbi:biotin carboxylase [Streptomyces olivoverticillatus]|uniref:Biotin carboxylase n=1 Tax=Streptomyces olivoverticillatus TaxID=66427 RepID=A0A7W7LPP4_9ACTN|nr:ATP-grasp domain-containing protein [Streptomyces olivoverticillatus]MBB4893662.1 biotin carboxylase [Streptomyces olivoverticillatus]
MADVTLLVLGIAGMPPWGQDQIRRLAAQARRRGVALVGADTPDLLHAASAAELALFDDVVHLDVHSPQACRSWAAATRPEVDAVATVRELSVLPAAVVAEELGLCGNSPEAVSRVRNKDLCRRRLREAGFPQPLSVLCRDAEDARRFLRDTGPGPWIVKPRDGLASIGVSRIDHPDQLPGALARLAVPSGAMPSPAAATGFLMETFVTGDEYSAEGILLRGVPHVLALTRKTVTEGFISTSQQVPSGLDEATARAAGDAVARGLTAVGITHGIFHVELWVTSSGIVLGEFHCRGGGDYIHALIEHTRPGLELYGTLVDDLLGRAPEPLPASSGAARVQFLFAPPGRLRAVRGWEEVIRHPSVLAAHLHVSPGDVIARHKDSFTRSAVFVTGTERPEDIDDLVTSLAARVGFETEDTEDSTEASNDSDGTDEDESAPAPAV